MSKEKHKLGEGYGDKKTSFFERLTPKKVILQGIRTRLEGTGITKLVLVFNVHSDKYNIMLSKQDGGSMKLDLDDNDVNTIKKLLVSRVYKKFQEISDKEIKCIIIEVNIDGDDLLLFTQDIHDNVELFDYKVF